LNCLTSYPNYFAFFNELAAGTKNGHKALLDSNLDWGQDLNGLKARMNQHGMNKIFLLYFGTAEPAYYGIDAVYLPRRFLRPRLFCADDESGNAPHAGSERQLFLRGADLCDAGGSADAQIGSAKETRRRGRWFDSYLQS
jgi:hypothetical protein